MCDTNSRGAALPIAVGIDTSRYGHHVTFLDALLQDATKPFLFPESHAGYEQLRNTLQMLAQRCPNAHFHIRIDVAGQYATNLETFLHRLPMPHTISIGEPDRNRKYREVHFPKRKADATESRAAARFAMVERPKPMPQVPSAIVQLREIASRLESQSQQVTRLTNQLHNLLARVFPELALVAHDFQARWLLLLLKDYPTPRHVADASLAHLATVPYLAHDKAQRLQAAARTTVASLDGAVAERLVRDLVDQLRNSIDHERRLHDLLVEQFQTLKPSNPIASIPGIGMATAAVLTAKMVDIDRFETADAVVGYFGTFDQEASSGVDRDGVARTGHQHRMSRKGNDLVRKYLWNAAKSAIGCNPAVKPLYRRLRHRGVRGDVALGHCMRKLLHLVFAIWKSGQPFDKNHYDWEHPRFNAEAQPAGEGSSPPTTPAPAPEGDNALAPQDRAGNIPPAAERPVAEANAKAAGHTQGSRPARQVVTAAASNVAATAAAVKEPSAVVARSTEPWLDFAALRAQVGLEQVLIRLKVLPLLKGSGPQRRGPCPVHDPAGHSSRSFSVNLDKNVFQCFHPPCAAHGNVLDLWAAVHQLPLREAAEDLARTFHLERSPSGGTEKRNP